MYYPCSENKGADQLRGSREADLRLCFRIGKNPVFSRCGSYNRSLAVTKRKNNYEPQFADSVYSLSNRKLAKFESKAFMFIVATWMCRLIHDFVLWGKAGFL